MAEYLFNKELTSIFVQKLKLIYRMNEQGKLATDVANNTVQCLMLGEAVNVTSANVTAYLPVIQVYAEEAANLKPFSQSRVME